jgi:DeoR family transcriptional regulator of aga operon
VRRYRQRATSPRRPASHEGWKRVADGSVVGLTSGATRPGWPGPLDRTGLTVVTNALNIAGELAIRSDLKLVVTGGTARPESYELVGPLAERTLEEMYLDVAIVGADGIALDEGLTTHHEVEAHTNRVLLERARAVDGRSTAQAWRGVARICPSRRSTS